MFPSSLGGWGNLRGTLSSGSGRGVGDELGQPLPGRIPQSANHKSRQSNSTDATQPPAVAGCDVDADQLCCLSEGKSLLIENIVRHVKSLRVVRCAKLRVEIS